MKRVHLISWVMCLGVAASVAAGDLWIVCAPGLDIFVDGESVGVSEAAENGKHLTGVEPGEHTIRIEKDGFLPAEFSLTLGPAPTQAVIGDLSPAGEDGLPGSTEGEEAGRFAGMIEIASNPRECNVKFEDQRVLKKQPIMTIAGIPVGEHKLWFESMGTVLSTTVAVQATQPTQVMVDFTNKRVAVVDPGSDQNGGESAGEEESPRVEIECIEYWVEVIRTSNMQEIEVASSILKDIGFPEYHQKIITIEDDGVLPLYKIRVGPVPRKADAKYPAHLLKQAGFKSVWILPEECQPPAEPTPRPRYKPIG